MQEPTRPAVRLQWELAVSAHNPVRTTAEVAAEVSGWWQLADVLALLMQQRRGPRRTALGVVMNIELGLRATMKAL